MPKKKLVKKKKQMNGDNVFKKNLEWVQRKNEKLQ
jgi:hypothetical protein